MENKNNKTMKSHEEKAKQSQTGTGKHAATTGQTHKKGASSSSQGSTGKQSQTETGNDKRHAERAEKSSSSPKKYGWQDESGDEKK